MYGSGYAEDPMQDEIKGFDFSEKTIRRGFIRFVKRFYTINIINFSLFRSKKSISKIIGICVF